MATRRNTKKAIVTTEENDASGRVSMDELHTRIMDVATCKKNKR